MCICTRKSTRVVVRCEESICIGPTIKVRQILKPKDHSTDAFCFAFMLAVLASAYWGHRIRFKVGFILERRLAMPKWCRTNNASSMLFCIYNRHPLGTQDDTKNETVVCEVCSYYNVAKNDSGLIHCFTGDFCMFCKPHKRMIYIYFRDYDFTNS